METRFKRAGYGKVHVDVTGLIEDFGGARERNVYTGSIRSKVVNKKHYAIFGLPIDMPPIVDEPTFFKGRVSSPSRATIELNMMRAARSVEIKVDPILSENLDMLQVLARLRASWMVVRSQRQLKNPNMTYAVTNENFAAMCYSMANELTGRIARAYSARLTPSQAEVLMDWIDGTISAAAPTKFQYHTAMAQVFGKTQSCHKALEPNHLYKTTTAATRGAAQCLFMADMLKGTRRPNDLLYKEAGAVVRQIIHDDDWHRIAKRQREFVVMLTPLVFAHALLGQTLLRIAPGYSYEWPVPELSEADEDTNKLFDEIYNDIEGLDHQFLNFATRVLK